MFTRATAPKIAAFISAIIMLTAATPFDRNGEVTSTAATISTHHMMALGPSASAFGDVPCGKCTEGVDIVPGGFIGWWEMDGSGCDTDYFCSVCSTVQDAPDAAEGSGPSDAVEVTPTDNCTYATNDSGITDAFSAANWVDTNGCAAYPCSESPDDIANITAAVAMARTDGAKALANVVLTSNGKITFNADRGAIQEAGCKVGTVALHIPLTASMQAAVAARLAVATAQ